MLKLIYRIRCPIRYPFQVEGSILIYQKKAIEIEEAMIYTWKKTLFA